MKNLRFIFVVATSPLFMGLNLPRANYMIKHPEKYDVSQRWKMALKIVDHLRRRAFTKTDVYGLENLPKEDGYIMYSNHQGKYDALGILLSVPKPCAMLWEEKSADRPAARQVCGLVQGKTINFTDYRAQIKVLNELAKEVEEGKNYLIFPEGGYTDNKNELQEFKTGCFTCSLKSKKPIVPVVLYDSWRSMDTNKFGKVRTQIHYLEPIYYEQYGQLKKKEIADIVKEKIEAKLAELRASDPLLNK